MFAFQYIQDVEEWLQPLDYIAFWEAVAPYDLNLLDRDSCDGLIAGGKADTAKVLGVLKFLAMMELRAAFNLEHRIIDPPSAQYLMRIH